MHYFKGAISEWDVKWSLSWDNYTLYLYGIPGSDDEDNKPEMEVRNAADIF